MICQQAGVTLFPTPALAVTVASGAEGRLVVTVTAGVGYFPRNRIREIHFGAATNAIIMTEGEPPRSGGFSLTPPPEARLVSFVVDRQVSDRPPMVPLTLVDEYGEWPTTVGDEATTLMMREVSDGMA
jgi:hypothetical protein